MLNIGNKTLMNLQEAVGWLLENNPLPFQSTANYVANTEIAMSTLVNPSPAKVRVGSLIFFADSKVSTVVGVTSNSFIVSDQYNDLVDDVVYVSNVAINASGHLICTLSNGDTIDAGLIKQVSNFSINGSQHLIVNYNDGTSTDLGAIFSGNITISGNLTVSGGVSGGAITGDSIIENMSGYAWTKANSSGADDYTLSYVGIVKNGNKITFAIAGSITPSEARGRVDIGYFSIPTAIGDKIFPINASNDIAFNIVGMFSAYNSKVDAYLVPNKSSAGIMLIKSYLDNLSVGVKYDFRWEITFLLSNNMAS